MKLEKLKNNHKKKIIIGGVIGLSILSAFILTTSKAKYKVTDSIKLGEGVVNYKVPDFKAMAMYIVDGSTETETTTMPSASEYNIIENRSYCNLSGTSTKDTGVVLKTVNGNHTFANIKKGDKCYLYFKKENSITVSELVASLNPTTGATNFTGISTTNEGLKSGTDYAGTTYYFRGNVTNNWVKFAGFYWRIIRINGDGTIRMIYNGANTTETGTGTKIGTKAFNATADSAEYVGLQYTIGSQRGTGTNSTILGTTNSTDATTLYGWYNTKIKGTNYEKYVNANSVFCSDRDVASGHSGYTGTTGTGSIATMFGSGHRALNSSSSAYNTTQSPVMACAASNQLRLPVGLITYDEVVYAGGFAGKNNTSYYLYTNQNYWTMSPSYFYGNESPDGYEGLAYVFLVNSNGGFNIDYVNHQYEVRPVINLRSDVKLTGSGTASSPYEVV